MATVNKFEDLKIWQEAFQLCKKVDTTIVLNKSFMDFPLKDQINRSAGSIMDNVAEGFGRGGNKEFRQFLFYANGSCDELKSQLYRSLNRNYITKNEFDELYENTVLIGKMINGFIQYLNKSPYKGTKFKENPATYSLKTEN